VLELRERESKRSSLEGGRGNELGELSVVESWTMLSNTCQYGKFIERRGME
jgi:hypothetical protein